MPYSVMSVPPWVLVEFMLVSPAIAENCFSSGVATEEAIVSGDAPGRPAWTLIVGNSTCELLEKYPNKAGICRSVIPNLFSLDAPAGQFDGIIPMYAMQAELMALAVIAAQKSTSSAYMK